MVYPKLIIRNENGQNINAELLTEAGTCRLFITPALHAADWGANTVMMGEQRTFTDGRVIVIPMQESFSMDEFGPDRDGNVWNRLLELDLGAACERKPLLSLQYTEA